MKSTCSIELFCFFVNVTATTEIYTDCHTLSLHDALPISRYPQRVHRDIAFIELRNEFRTQARRAKPCQDDKQNRTRHHRLRPCEQFAKQRLVASGDPAHEPVLLLIDPARNEQRNRRRHEGKDRTSTRLKSSH